MKKNHIQSHNTGLHIITMTLFTLLYFTIFHWLR